MKHISFPNGQTDAQPKRSDRSLYRRAFPKGLAIGLFTLAAVIVLTGSLVYGEGGDDALLIDQNGNVGIGTTDPKARLDVSGKANTDKQISLQLRSGNNANNYESNQITFGWDGTDTFRHAIKTRHHGSQIGGNAIDFYVWKYGTGKDAKAAIGGLHTMTLNGGNVGIGTTEPEARLDVKGGGGPTVDLRVSGRIRSNSSEGGLWLSDGNDGFVGNNGKNIGFYTNSVLWNAFQIRKSDGNVGIGTTEPKARLDVIGGGGSNVDLRVSGRIRSNSSEGGLWLSDGNDGFVGNNDKNIGFHTHSVKWNAFQIRKSDGYVGIGTTEPKARLDVRGNVEVHGNLFVHGKLAYYWGSDKSWKHIQNRAGDMAGSYSCDGPKSSDLRFKSELQSIPSALNKILKLRGVTYRWNDDALRYFTRDIEDTLSAGPNATEAENHKLWRAEREKRYKELAKINVGIIAQDVEAVLPEAVTTDEEGYKSVRYHYLIPLLIEALKEQDKTVKEQAQVVAQLQQEIVRLVAANLAVQQQLAELATVKAQVAMLEAAVQRVAATQASGASDAVAHLFKTKAH